MAKLGKDFHVALDILKAFDGCRDACSLQTYMISALARYGYQHALVMAAATPANRKSSAERTLLCTWPKAWFDQYHQDNFVLDDPIVHTARNSLRAFRWSEVNASSRKAKFIMAAARKDHGLSHGICIPIRSLEGFYAAVSFAGDEIDHDTNAKFFAELIAIYAFHRISNFGETSPPRVLTERQREIMNWVAAGKTAWDISVILHISEHTVRKTISNVMERLNVRTRAQAIAEAMRRGELAP